MERSRAWLLLSTWYMCFAVMVQAGAAYPANQYCCQELQKLLPGLLHYANDTSYKTSVSTFWSKQEQSLSPACVLTPKSAQDVSTAVKSLSASRSCRFAVKSGGHMAQAGAANIQDGITIDLSGLNQFVISDDKALATIGPGLRWGEVYQKLGAYGLAFPGGRSGQVGVGGYLLGGGSSYFIPHGFGCDNVAAYEIVLASGTILGVTASSHGDLFKALKGGSSNFGIVTSYVIRPFPLGGIWGGNMNYLAEATVDQQLKAFNEFAGDEKFDVNAAVQMSIAFAPAIGNVFVDQAFYALPQENPPALQPFTNIQPQASNETALSTLAPFAIADAAASPDGSRQMTWALSFQNDLQTLHALYAAFNASIASIADVAGIGWAVTLEPLPKTFLQGSNLLGGNLLGLPLSPRGNAVVLCDSSFSWTNDNDTTRVRNAGLKLLNDINTSAQQLGTYISWIDVNHADFTQDPIASFGPANKAFLQGTSRKYDPTGVFQHQVPGGFKVFP